MRRPASPLGAVRRMLVPVAEGEALVAAAPPVAVREVFRRFWPFARPHRWALALGILCAAAVPAVEAAGIWLFKIVVDEVLVPRDFGPFPWIAAGFVALTIAEGVLGFLDDYLTSRVGGQFVLALRTDAFRHVQTLSMDFFERRRLGDLVARLTSDISAIESFVVSGIVDLVTYVARLFFFTAALLYLQWDLALVALLVAPLFWGSARRFSRLIKHASREKRRRSGSISAIAEESLSNAAVVQAYNAEGFEVARFRREAEGHFEAHMASTRLKALFSPLVDLFELTGALVVLGLGTWSLSEGRLTLGGLLVFLTYLTQLYRPIRGLSRLTNTLYAASASAERVIEILDERPSVRERPRALSIGRRAGRVEFERVRFRYPRTAADAVQDVSFALEPGTTLALVGPSGAGKSTIAKLMLRFYDPTAGRILLDGHDLRDLRLHALRDNVALLLQETLIFDGTIRDNIAYGRPSATDKQIQRAALGADADDFIGALPDGYETVVGQKGRRLSGGQRQRVAIARAMIRDAPVLVLDEPTTGLDAETGRRVLEPLRRLMDGRTTLVISHSLLTVRDADAIATLEGGRITERGTADELIARGGAYARLHRLHVPDNPAGRTPPARVP